VALGIVKDDPGSSAAPWIRFVMEDAFGADASDGAIQVGDFEKKDGFVSGGIILRAFAFEADEAGAAVEFCMMAGLFVGERKAEAVAIESFGAIEIVEIEFDTSEVGTRDPLRGAFVRTLGSSM
jgi:hypothetical protein